MSSVKIVSQQYFKYDQSDFAKSLRKLYGENGYQKYTAKMNSIMTEKDLTNPITKTKEAYTQAKKEDYAAALAALKKADNVWSGYKNQYSANLNSARTQNGGLTISGSQKQSALQNSGDGAVTAFNNFNKAQSEADYRLSLYNDATHSGMSYLS